MNKQLTILLVLCILPFSIPQTHAQLDESRKDIQLNTSPKYPGPNEIVRVEAQSYSFDTRTTLFTWSVDDVEKGSGIGKTSVSITTKNIGVSTRVTVKASPASGIPYENSITITPSHMDVLWHSNSYTPAWYRGKALPARGSIVIITALPMFTYQGTGVKSSALVYDWWLDNKLLRSGSGIGKNSLSVNISSNGNIVHRVRVRAADPASGITQEKNINLVVQNPKLLFYELDPLRGPRADTAIGNLFTLPAGSETKFLSVPYYISGNPRSFQHTWNVGTANLPVSGDADPTALTYRAEQGAAGRQTISLILENPRQITEQVRGSFQIIVQ
ncbi:MAG: hypothetical protein AAB710_00935 [Patescibacteria group bacterium]